MEFRKLLTNDSHSSKNLHPASILSSPLNQIWWWLRVFTRLFTKTTIIRWWLLNSVLKSTTHHLMNGNYDILKKLMYIISRGSLMVFLWKGLLPTQTKMIKSIYLIKLLKKLMYFQISFHMKLLNLMTEIRFWYTTRSNIQ